MSTKIFTGFKFTSSNAFALDPIFNEYRKIIYPMIEERLLRATAERIAYSFDAYVLGLTTEEPELSPYLNYRKIMKEYKKDNDAGLRSQYDFFCTLSMFVISEENMFIGFMITENRDHYDRFIELDGVEDFSYWNNVDAPNDVPTAEWNRRSKIWKLADKRQPVTHMPVDDEFPIGMDVLSRVPDFYPTDARRANQAAQNAAFGEALKAAEEAGKPLKSGYDMMVIMNSEPVKDRAKELKEEYLPRITDIEFYRKMRADKSA